MQVLKFGGTSVGSAKNIDKVISILNDYSNKGKVICVVSAVGGITDKLLNAGRLAEAEDKDYKAVFKDIKLTHLNILSKLVPDNNDVMKEFLKEKLKQLKSLLDGIYLINELSPQISDRLVSLRRIVVFFHHFRDIEIQKHQCRMEEFSRTHRHRFQFHQGRGQVRTNESKHQDLL